jgi:hypothetical protein
MYLKTMKPIWGHKVKGIFQIFAARWRRQPGQTAVVGAPTKAVNPGIH